MKIINRTLLIVLLLQYICNSVFATETRITQLFITNEGQEFRHVFLYDEFGNVQLETKYVQSGSNWQPSTQTEWYYTSSDFPANLTMQVERVRGSNSWHDTDVIETQYDAQGRKSEEVFSRYVSNVKTPVKTVKYEYLNGELSSVIEYVNNVPVLANNMWQEDELFFQEIIGNTASFLACTAYNAEGKPQAMLVQTTETTVQNTDSITWFYDADGLLFSQRSRKWNEQGRYWDNTQMVNFEYDAVGNLTAESYLQWSGMHWENIYRYEYQYENNVQTRRTLKGQIHRDWRNMISIKYSDFQNDKARDIKSEFDFWGGNAGELTASFIPFYFNDELQIRRAEHIRVSYDEITEVGTGTNHFGIIIQVYPNPSDGIFYLSTATHQMLSWRVFNFNGQMVKSHVQRTHSGVIDLTELPKGIYILQVETIIGTQQQKLIKN